MDLITDFEYIKNRKYDKINPTVILIHGLLCDKTTWYQTNKQMPIKFLDNIKKKFSVVIFTIPASYYLLPIDDLVYQIYNLLVKNEVSVPYIIMGHSYGGLISYKFATSYQKHTIGLFLIDSSTKTEAFIDRINSDNKKELSELEYKINVSILKNLKNIVDGNDFPEDIIVNVHFDMKDINLSRNKKRHLYDKDKMEKDNIELMEYHKKLISRNINSKMTIHSVGHFIHHKDYDNIIKNIILFSKK